MSQTLKLTYFPVRGRAEHIRYIFAQCEIPHQEVFIQREEWPIHKPNMPMGQLPVLDINGKQLCQSMAIGRYLAREHGLAGKNSLEMAFADMLCDGITDIITAGRPFVLAHIANDMAKKKEEYEKFRTDSLIPFLTKYAKFLKENGTGWFVGNGLTWADLTVAEYVDRIQTTYGDDLPKKDFPTLEEHRKKIHEMPSIAKYVKSRQNYPL